MKKESIYRVIFSHHGKIYDMYARSVSQSQMFGFIDIEEFVFGENSSLLVDPGEEKIKAEFQSVKRTYVPLHSILRIDEVLKEGLSKISEGSDNVLTPFPKTIYSRSPGEHS